MDIAEVAKRSGVPASTLRYYEERGLIASVGRSGLRRVFAPAVLERLALIALGRAAGLSLGEIVGMTGTRERPEIDRVLLAQKAKELDTSISKMTAVRDGLRHAVACSAPNHLECPKFRRLMGLAASTVMRGKDKGKPKPIRKIKRPAGRRSLGVV